MFGGNYAISYCADVFNDTSDPLERERHREHPGVQPALREQSAFGAHRRVRRLRLRESTSHHLWRGTVFPAAERATSNNDTWVLSNIFSGTPTWTQIAKTGTLFPANAGHVAVYDQTNNRMIVFGGGTRSNLGIVQREWDWNAYLVSARNADQRRRGAGRDDRVARSARRCRCGL